MTAWTHLGMESIRELMNPTSIFSPSSLSASQSSSVFLGQCECSLTMTHCFFVYYHNVDLRVRVSSSNTPNIIEPSRSTSHTLIPNRQSSLYSWTLSEHICLHPRLDLLTDRLPNCPTSGLSSQELAPSPVKLPPLALAAPAPEHIHIDVKAPPPLSK